MSKSPAFQFYAKDWLSSSKIALMPPEFEGAYIRLLAYCWDSGDCSLPDDDEQLASLSRLGERWLKGGSTVLRKCFMPHPTKAGYLSNQKLLDEATKQANWRQKSREGGKASAAKRAEKRQQSKGGSRVVQPKGNSASASSSSIDSGTKVPSSPPTPVAVKMPFGDIPSDWKQQAMEEKGWTENIVLDIWANFRDYWTTGKGKGTKRVDWGASWRTWFRKENISTKGTQYGKQPTQDERARAAVHRAAVAGGFAPEGFSGS